MGNESGEWIMYGVDWDDPECIHTVDEAMEYINEVGFLPLFKNDIPGFSLEETTWIIFEEISYLFIFLKRSRMLFNKQETMYPKKIHGCGEQSLQENMT